MSHTKRWDKWGLGGREEDRQQDKKDKYRKQRSNRNRQASSQSDPVPPPDPLDIKRGKIYKVDVGKGFGFITPQYRQKSIFFHASVLCDGLEMKNLVVGQRVKYQAKWTDDGMRATMVSPV